MKRLKKRSKLYAASVSAAGILLAAETVLASQYELMEFVSLYSDKRDELNDYDEDYRYFEPLGDVKTCDMKWHIKRKLELVDS